ncbi:MAG: S8 family serine peptidase [Bacteroidota bacterium]
MNHRKSTEITFALFVFCCLLSWGAVAQSGAPVIHLKAGDITVSAPTGRTSGDNAAVLVGESDPMQVLVHFAALPTDEQKRNLAANGIQLLDYIPDNTYTAIIARPAVAVRSVNSGYTLLKMQPEWKADRYLWNRAGGQGNIDVQVSFYAGVDAAQIKEFIGALGGQAKAGPTERYGIYRATIAKAMLRSLASWYAVKFISPLTDIVPLDLQSRPAVKGNIAVASPAFGGYGLAGDSVTVGVGDNASGIYHADLKDRITNFNPGPEATHGEHVNGIVGAAANVDPLAASMAPHVSLVDFLYDMVLPATGAMYDDYNMTITNNSYSVMAADCDYSGTYDGNSDFLDTLALQYPNVLHVFASGNDGWMTCPPYPQSFATVAGGYQPAKNNVVVGSITDYLEKAGDQSHGPVRDGRLKPEVVAVGLGAYSTIGVDRYGWAAGTSMASPQVAGGLAVLTQHYKRLNGGTQPRADLLKTILVNGAMDIGNAGPDFTYGFGAMDVSRSLKMIDEHNYAMGAVANGNSQSFTITIPANTAQARIMLCWHDVPASPTSSKQLVNDLDLTVTTPSSTVHRPMILDPSPANVDKLAVEGDDRINNIEQVTINNPVAGTYTIKVNGHAVPAGVQAFAIAYDFIPQGVQLTYPLGGEQLSNVDSIRVFWNAISNGNTFTVEFSADNGDNWIPVATNIPANMRYCPFMPAGFNSGNCKVRVIRNGSGETGTSQRFAINKQPVAALSVNQCPGYMNIHWSPVPNATAYIMLRKIGFYMQVVDTVTDTVYSFGGLPLTEKSYVAVQPVIHGIPGYRSVAVIARANSGNCAGTTASVGDIMVERIISPVGGRMFTSTQFGTVTTLRVLLRNLYTAAAGQYTLSYRVNTGPWQTLVNPGAIPANGTIVISIPNLVLSAPGSYDITVAVRNTVIADPQRGNDTANIRVLHLPNAPISLATPYADGFEDMPAFEVRHDSLGVSPNGHWDYFNTDDSGRMRSFVSDDITITGNRSVSLDEWLATQHGSNNTFTGTFNLATYDTGTTEVRVDFDYILHGTPKEPDGNIVYARGNDLAPWKPLHAYDLAAYPGSVTHVKSRSLTDAVRAGATNFTTSTQVSFLQNDTSLIGSRTYGNGITIDNFRMYTVANDAELLSIEFPLVSNCGLPASVPLKVKVHNGVNYTLYNIVINYRLDSTILVSNVIDSIGAKDTITYTFSTPMNIAPGTAHRIDVWLNSPGDTYLSNDSIINYFFRNSLIVSNYPYLENFEANDGGYYAAGLNSTWQYGMPAANRINKAASGVRAWKTNLTGRHKNLEKSFLYSPCFDIASLQSPMLSFSAALEIENCGNTLCDAAYVEYSFDGAVWSRLGTAGQGTNWYDSAFNAWTNTRLQRWHVASIPLPQPPAGKSIRFRFAMNADPGVALEGMAIDDVHIFDRTHTIYTASGVKGVPKELANNQWNDVLYNDKLIASLRAPAGTEQATVGLYEQQAVSNPSMTQYTLPRSYTIKTDRAPLDSVSVRLFLTDSEFVRVLDDTACPSCSPVQDAYALGITQYTNIENRAAENGTLADNIDGITTYRPHSAVQWVPYDNGYYAQFKTKSFSEFWFNDGGPTGNFAATDDYLNFIAFKSGDKVTTYWHSLIDTAVDRYVLERAQDSAAFEELLDTAAANVIPGEYTYVDPLPFAAGSTRYYRLTWTMEGSNTRYYSPVRKVTDVDSAAGLVKLEASMISHSEVLVKWTSYIDGLAERYILERAVGDGGYTTINEEPALKRYGQQYLYTDMPGSGLRDGAQIHYRLTVVLADGSRIVLPVRTVSWINNNNVVNIYPNPTFDGTFTVNWFADAGTKMNVAITNVVGQAIYESSATATQWSNTTTFNTFSRAKGVYIVRMEIQGKMYIARMVYE